MAATLPSSPPQRPRPSGFRLLLILLAIVSVSVGVRLLLQLSSSFQDNCPAKRGGAVLDVSGDVTMDDAVFVVEDANCLWESLPGMYVEFDSRKPAVLAFGGSTRLGSNRNAGLNLWAGAPIVAYSTDLAANRNACTIEIVDSTTERIAGSITCTRLAGARYSAASGLQRLRGANARAINVVGTFEFTT